MSAQKQYTLDELKAKLTDKQRIFCHEYIIDWNATRSAKIAGYSEETAYSIGWENLKKPEIKQYIDLIKNNLEEESGISKLRNLKELAKIAYSGIAHLHDNWIELSDWEQIKEDNPEAMSAIESIDTKTETKVYKTDGNDEQEVEIKYVKVKLFSKTEAIKTINEMMGYKAPTKTELSGEVTTVTMTPEQRDKRIAELAAKLKNVK